MFPINRLIIPILLAAILSTQPCAFPENYRGPIQSSSNQKTDKPVPCPLGLAWGDSAATVKKVLLAQGYTQDIIHSTDPSTVLGFDARDISIDPSLTGLLFNAKGISIDGEKIESVVTVATKKGLGAVVIHYVKPTTDQDMLARFHRIVKKLADTYGPPSRAVYRFVAPYKSGDGHEIDAIENGKGYVSDSWFFHPSNTQSAPGIVTLCITSAPDLQVTYYNQTLLPFN